MGLYGTGFNVKLTEYEWSLLRYIAGGTEENLKKWINIQLHTIADKTQNDISLIQCSECNKSQKVYFIPEHLLPQFDILSRRYNGDFATLVQKFIISPEIKKQQLLLGFY